MYKTSCVRCNENFSLPFHPIAHASSICHKCNEIDPENLSDQFERDRRNNLYTLIDILKGK